MSRYNETFVIEDDDTSIIARETRNALLNSAEYWEWYSREALNIRTIGELNAGAIPKSSNIIAVGTIDHVEYWMKHMKIPIPAPLDIPVELEAFLGERGPCQRGPSSDLYAEKSAVDIHYKDISMSKGASRMVERGEIIGGKNDRSLCRITKWVEMISEWRVFVKNNKVIGVCNYRGDPLMFPNSGTIAEMISAYTLAPAAYTLDVAVIMDGKTIIVECHNFYACGLYGLCFTDAVDMWYRWWKYYTSKCGVL